MWPRQLPRLIGAVEFAAALSLLWILMLAATPAQAAPTLIINPSFTETRLNAHVDVLQERGERLTIEAVTSPPLVHEFLPLDSLGQPLARAHRGLWFRFALHNGSSEARSFILQLKPADLAGATLYRIGRDDNAISTSSLGEAHELSLQLPSQTTRLYYLRLQAASLQAPSLQLYATERYLAVHKQEDHLTGAALGALLMLVMVAIAANLLGGDRLFLWAGGLGLVFALALPLLQGRLAMLGLGEPVWRSAAIALGILFGLICSARLILDFPLYPAQNRMWRTAVRALIAAGAMALIAVLVLPPSLHMGLLTSVLILAMLIGYGASLHLFLHEHSRLALSYALLRLTLLLLLLLGLTTGREPLSGAILLLVGGCIELGGLLLILLHRQWLRQAEQTARARQVAVAEAESRSRTEIIADVGHRIRTPVSGVLGMLEILQDTPLTPTQREYLGTAQRAGSELLNVVDDLTDITRAQPFTNELQQSTFDPQALLAECVDGFRGAAAAQTLELITDPAADLPAYVSGDATRVRQILLQLLHIAVNRYQDGEVVMRLLPGAPNWLRFELNASGETGPDQPKVTRLDRGRHRAGASNLRLDIARQLVDLLGGRLHLEDRRSQLRARVELPLPGTVEIAADAGWEQLLRNRRLLLVDDNSTFCEVLRRQASSWGMQVHAAASVAEALAWLRNQELLEQPVDVLLLDADMPEMASSDWLERLPHELTRQPIIVLLASQPTLEGRADLQELGIRRLLLKPLNHASLKITLAEELNYHAQDASRPAPLARPLHCLIAEDNPIATQVLARMLEKLDVRYTAVANGQQAVEACQRESFDMILMDGEMPVMDGWEAARRIREAEANRGETPTPIIALTANTLEELGDRARRSVMDAHLVKPIHLHELRALLQRWTGKTLA